MPDFNNQVRLVDAVIPEVYTSYTAIDRPELTAFFMSGAVTSNDFLAQFLSAPGRLINIPFWRDLDSLEPNYGSDNPNVEAPIDGLGSGEMKATKTWLNKAYGAMDLTAELAGSNPMTRIRNRFGTYWTRQWQRRIIAMAVGVYKSNVAGNFATIKTRGRVPAEVLGTAGDMVIDISGQSNPADAVFNREAFVDAAFTMGDHVGSIAAIAVHSMVYKRMTNNDEIEFIPDSKGQLTIPTYMGKVVIVDDGMPVFGTGANKTYLSILFGGAAFGYANGAPQVPVAVGRRELRGNGSGLEYILERKEWIVHPGGFNWLDADVTIPDNTGSPSDITSGPPAITLANLANPDNWERVTYRKNVPMAFLVTKG